MDREGFHEWSPSQAAAEREAKRRPLFYTYSDPWPFVAVFFVLLVIFMVGFGPIHHDIPVDLPSSFYSTAQAKALAEDAMKIRLTRDGRLYFRNTRVFVKSLPILIRGAVQEGAEKKVYLEGDARVRYADAAAVVEQIGNSGIREICILAYKPER